MSRGTLGLRDPDVERMEREAARRTFRPLDRALPCSCGCVAAHEVARRHLSDGGLLVVRSDGEVRAWAPGAMSPEVWHVDRFARALRELLGWASVMDAGEVAEALSAMEPSP